MRRVRESAGFQRLELIGVVALLVLLGGVVVPMARKEMGITRRMRAENDLAAIAGAFERYHEHLGGWPACKEADRPGASVAVSRFMCLYENPGGLATWRGPYLRTDDSPIAARVASPAAETLPLHTSAELSLRVRRDPWGREYRVLWPRDGAASRVLAIVSLGENGVLETTLEDLAASRKGGDDVIQIVNAR